MNVTTRKIAAGHYIVTSTTDSHQVWTVVRDDDDMIGLPWWVFEEAYTDRAATDHLVIWGHSQSLHEAKETCSRHVLAVLEDDEIRCGNVAQKDAHVTAYREYQEESGPEAVELDYFAALKELRRLTGAAEYAAARTMLFAFDQPSKGSTLAGVHVRFFKNGTTGAMHYTLTAA